MEVAKALGIQSDGRLIGTHSGQHATALRLAVEQARRGRTVNLHSKDIDIRIGPCPSMLSWMLGSETQVMLMAHRRQANDEQAQLQFFGQSFGFTSRECEVLFAYSQHFDVRRTAQSLAVSYETARWHIKNMLSKCGQPSLERMIHAALKGAVLD